MLSDKVSMHLNRMLAFAFGRHFYKKSFDFLRSNNCYNQSNSTQQFMHVEALDNQSLRNFYNLGKFAYSTNIIHVEERNYKPVSKSEAKKYKLSNQL